MGQFGIRHMIASGDLVFGVATTPAAFETLEEAKAAAARRVADDGQPVCITKVIMKVESEVPPVIFTDID